jgi:hypothetical protein
MESSVDSDLKLSKRISSLLHGYFDQYGLKGANSLLHIEAKVALLRDGNVSYTTAEKGLDWIKYIRLCSLPSTFELRKLLTTLNDLPLPATEEVGEIKRDAFAAAGPQLLDRMAIEAAQGLNSLPSTSQSTKKHADLKPPSRTLNWIAGALLCLLLAVAQHIASEGDANQVEAWASSTVGLALGLAIFPLIVCAFTRFRDPWIFMGLTALCGVIVIAFPTDHAAGSVPVNQAVRQQNQPSPISTSTVADASIASNPQVSSAMQNAWDQDVAHIVQLHPALRYGRNLQLLQEKLNGVAKPGISNGDMLDEAYAQTVNDARWAPGP